MKTLALCANVPELMAGDWRDREVCKKYPGSGWAPYLPEYAARFGMRVMSGPEALTCVDPWECLVISEEENEDAQALVAFGARPALVFTMESPLYTPRFYDRLPVIKERYPRQMLFSGGTDHLYFPSFDLAELHRPEPAEPRLARACAVISNKHYSMLGAQWADSPSWQAAVRAQLQDYRYAVLKQGARDGVLDLYGRGWPEGVAKPVDDKLATLRRYRTCFCPENIRMPGYVTEKLIEALVAGCTPIYEGAPDVDAWVPGWRSPERARAFLRSEMGRRYSYQGFAETVAGIVAEVAGLKPEAPCDPSSERPRPAHM